MLWYNKVVTRYDERESSSSQGTRRTKKGKSFLKKSGGILCEGNRLEAYRFIDQHQTEFGIRWLLNRLHIYPNAYYNYRKQRKAEYYTQKEKVKAQIQEIYHAHHGVDGYRSMKIYLAHKGYSYSFTTIHKYMNVELGLHSIVRPKKPRQEQGKAHKVFENKLGQVFTAEKPNQKWCTDFTYLFLKSGEVRYNCSILDLYDRSIVASITDRAITSDLAIRTLQKALTSQKITKGELMLHSDYAEEKTIPKFLWNSIFYGYFIKTSA